MALAVQPTVYRRGGRWYGKVRFSDSHPDRVGRRSAWRNVPTGASSWARALAGAEFLQERPDQGLPLRGLVVGAGALTIEVLCDRFCAEYQRPRLKHVERYRALAARHLWTLVLPQPTTLMMVIAPAAITQLARRPPARPYPTCLVTGRSTLYPATSAGLAVSYRAPPAIGVRWSARNGCFWHTPPGLTVSTGDSANS